MKEETKIMEAAWADISVRSFERVDIAPREPRIDRSKNCEETAWITKGDDDEMIEYKFALKGF